jgi:hypothetical protein
MMDEVLRWMTSFGAAGVLLAIINGLFSKRKLSAEATKLITDAASGTLADVREDYKRVRDENAQLRERIAASEARLDAVEKENKAQARHQQQTDALIVVHGEWDRQAFYAAKSSGIQLPEPPPLTIGG